MEELRNKPELFLKSSKGLKRRPQCYLPEVAHMVVFQCSLIPPTGLNPTDRAEQHILHLLALDSVRPNNRTGIQ
jgi:hypothetical protein